ncbi:MAG: hypothetical protein ACC613_08570 [Synergistales bacterium]
MFKDADLDLEVVILFLAGMTTTIAGILLFPVSSGLLPYYENGLYGLLLFFFAVQIVALGKTPFGEMRRSKPLLAAGVLVAATGIVTCFVPDILARLPRLALAACLGLGGLLQLVRMFASKEKFSTWIEHGGILKYLAPACGAVYLLSMSIGLLVWKHELLPVRTTAAAVLAYGAAILALAILLRKVYRLYPEAAKIPEGEGGLPIDKAMILLTGVFMLILGTLLVPVNLGLIPFSGSAQLGLLVVIQAIQTLASGSTPIGPFRRSWLMIALGFPFAALGVVSCIVPGVLVPVLTLLIAVLNVAGGLLGLKRTLAPMLERKEGPRGPVPPVLVRLNLVQVAMNLVSVMFGASMLIANLIPGRIIGVILAANGALLLYLLHLLGLIEKMASEAEARA